ncbi:MAG: hypothetical protein EAZ51_08300 [Sphingobacteriales bacterium]|nr:MAG: hypothetical protein EAZ64_08240 [Sphingobacteriales bacterium]TAF79070.1 MAG: hypothetical protein EAZ51_08300 [Sphingobacteriales bacterium]
MRFIVLLGKFIINNTAFFIKNLPTSYDQKIKFIVHNFSAIKVKLCFKSYAANCVHLPPCKTTYTLLL